MKITGVIKSFRYIKKIFSPKTIFVFLLSFFMLTGYSLFSSISHPIKRLKIYGSLNHISKKQIHAMLIDSLNKDTFFSINLESIRDHLLSNPWISRIFIRRQWPDKVTITIEEKTIMARWNDNDFFDKTGVTFPVINTEDFLKYPLLMGGKESKTLIWNEFMQIKKLLENYQFKIKYLRTDSNNQWVLGLDHVVIKIKGKNISQKIKNLLNLFALSLHQKWYSIAAIDLCYANGVVVKWKENK